MWILKLSLCMDLFSASVPRKFRVKSVKLTKAGLNVLCQEALLISFVKAQHIPPLLPESFIKDLSSSLSDTLTQTQIICKKISFTFLVKGNN